MSLLVFVSLYLGVNFSLKFDSISKDIFSAMMVRVFAVFLPMFILCFVFFSGDEFKLILSLIGLAVFLPVSSLAPHLTQTPIMREWVANQVITSSALYVVILFIASVFKTIFL